MGRTLKRVPLDFDWPINAKWYGYLNPFRPTSCPACEATGVNPETKKLLDDWYDFYSETGRGWKHDLSDDEIQALYDKGRLSDISEDRVPTLEEVNDWDSRGIGHDVINRWICVKTRAKRLGVYGKCKWCHGNDGIFHSEEHKRLYESWLQTEPPEGPGFQVWETTTEGSPVSPVFTTLDALCEWCEKNATIFASHRGSKEQWKKMLTDDFVCYEDKDRGFMFM
jgi:hypothetical protein